MTTPFAFRLSIYLTLILGSVSLGYSEWEYLPEVTVFTAINVLAMAAAFVMDQRGRYLSLKQANVVGVMIFVLVAAWIGYHYGRADSLMHILPWPAGGLPYIGPLLMLLAPAKLFRPKHVGDWWALYGISLACVGLAIAMAEDGLFVALVLLYAATAVWSLTLFYAWRLTGESSVADPETPAPRFPYLWPAVRWVAVASVVAVPVFFATPRTTGVHWELFRSKLETGMPLDGSPDLSRTGMLRPSHEVAFEVMATRADGRAKLNLPYDQRWRGMTYTEYLSPRGRWTRRDRSEVNRLLTLPDIEKTQPTPTMELPDFGPDGYRLDFTLRSRTGGHVFADPVTFIPGERAPIAVPLRNNYGYAWQSWDGAFVFLQREYRHANRYLQACGGRDDRGREQFSSFRLAEPENPDLFAPFLSPPPPGIAEYAGQLLKRFLTDGTLPRGVRERMNAWGAIDPNDHAAVAEAFRYHLSYGGGYTYTLDLRRQDRTRDPVEDFLFNTRSGHCERFASALVLLLRGLEIPAQLVLGYRGHEPQGHGLYFIRQEHAHAWAEVLLSRTVGNDREWYWKAYDATPLASPEDPETTSNLLESSAKQGQLLFSEFVINLNPESQRRLTENITTFLNDQWPLVLAGLLLLPAGLVAGRKFIRRVLRFRMPSTNGDPAPWYTALHRSLLAAGLPPVAGETPREFAERAIAWLPNPSTVPRDAAAVLYCIRYAEMPAEDRLASVQRDIAALTRSLAGRSHKGEPCRSSV